jgi:acyl-CoA synthetase (AMP-forming)/AMP-acid ligase II
MILTQAFNQSAAREPGHPALIEPGTTIPYVELRGRIGRLSNLYQAEIPHGGRVAILASNGSAFAQTFFALSNSGNPVILLDPKDTEESHMHDIRQLGCHALLVSNEYTSRAQEMLKRAASNIKIIEIEKRRAGEYDPSFQSLPDRPLKDTDPVLVIRQDDTGSSSIADRKYCIFNHKQVIASATSVKRFYQLKPTDRMLTTMHWSHPFALTHGLLLPLFTGATSVADPQSPGMEEFVEFLADQRVTRFAGPPKFYLQLLQFCLAKKYTLPGVKSITVGMGSVSLALRKTFKLLKIPVLRCYGRKEAIWSLAMDHVEEALDMEAAKSHPAPGVNLRVLNEEGEEIPGPGPREGRLMASAESVATGYYHPDPKIAGKGNADRFRGTWLKTGDVARLDGEDDEPTVAVLGRLENMLFRDGLYLSPRRIDDAAQKVTGLADAAGFVRINKNHEPEFACAVVSAGAKLNDKEVLRQLEEELPDEYHPRTVYITDSLPRDAFDSVNRLALQRQFSAV